VESTLLTSRRSRRCSSETKPGPLFEEGDRADQCFHHPDSVSKDPARRSDNQQVDPADHQEAAYSHAVSLAQCENDYGNRGISAPAISSPDVDVRGVNLHEAMTNRMQSHPYPSPCHTSDFGSNSSLNRAMEAWHHRQQGETALFDSGDFDGDFEGSEASAIYH
jgi:hypothetical protein